jgi:hypothetical protein
MRNQYDSNHDLCPHRRLYPCSLTAAKDSNNSAVEVAPGS